MPGAGALELSFWSSEDPEARRGEDQKDTAPVANVWSRDYGATSSPSLTTSTYPALASAVSVQVTL